MRNFWQFNFPAFDAAAARLRAQGHEVRSPAEKDRADGFDETKNSLEGFDMHKALRWDVESVLWCEAVVVLPGWENSEGCKLETAVARAIGTPIYPLDADPTFNVKMEKVHCV